VAFSVTGILFVTQYAGQIIVYIYNYFWHMFAVLSLTALCGNTRDGKPEEKRQSEDLGIDEKIILEWILGKW
jgi:hypothetical protein